MKLVMNLQGLKLKSGNKMLRAHWAVRRKKIKECRELVWVELIQAKVLSVQAKLPAKSYIAKGKRSVTITRHWPRLLDTVNLYTSVKPLEDALVFHGLLVDDRSEFCDLTVKQEKALQGDWQGFVIEITEEGVKG